MNPTAPIEVCDAHDLIQAEVRLDGHRGPCSRELTDVVQLPLWLTAGEAETLALLCAVSPSVAPDEELLFRKVGELLRAFSR